MKEAAQWGVGVSGGRQLNSFRGRFTWGIYLVLYTEVRKLHKGIRRKQTTAWDTLALEGLLKQNTRPEATEDKGTDLTK